MTASRYRLIILAALAAHSIASLAIERQPSQRAAFVRANPCPATGKARGPCPGFVVDHITPLCAGGLDHPANMQWQTAEDAKTKDREERRLCRTSSIK